MRDFELYQVVLRLQAPWSVSNVALNVPGQQVIVTVDAGAGPRVRSGAPAVSPLPHRTNPVCHRWAMAPRWGLSSLFPGA